MKCNPFLLAIAFVSTLAPRLALAREPNLPEGFESADPPKSALPWSFMFNIGGASTWGKPADPDNGTYGPSGSFDMSLFGSVWYVYSAAGFSHTRFYDLAPVVDAILILTGSNNGGISGSPSANSGWIEAGASHTFAFPVGEKGGCFQLMPSLGYGFQGMGSLSRDGVGMGVDYHAGQYIRLMLGLYGGKDGRRSAGSRFGGTISYQRFLTPGERSLTDQLVLWFSVGTGRFR